MSGCFHFPPISYPPPSLSRVCVRTPYLLQPLPISSFVAKPCLPGRCLHPPPVSLRHSSLRRALWVPVSILGVCPLPVPTHLYDPASLSLSAPPSTGIFWCLVLNLITKLNEVKGFGIRKFYFWGSFQDINGWFKCSGDPRNTHILIVHKTHGL